MQNNKYHMNDITSEHLLAENKVPQLYTLWADHHYHHY